MSELYHANGSSNGYDSLNQLTAFSRGVLSDSNSDGVPDTIADPTNSQYREFDKNANALRFREIYYDLVCSRCRKVNEIEAAKRGIAPDVKFKVVRDIMSSSDDQVVVSSRFRDILVSAAPGEVDFYGIPGNRDLFVAFPRVLLEPEEHNDAFTITGKCGLCGRFTEAIWGPGIALPPIDCKVAAYRLESHVGMIARWEVDENVACALKNARPKLKGLILRAR
jgi:hypothetical protein